MVHASVFSGIGAPELAADMLGWKNAFHCEINPFGRAILDFYYPKSKSYEDITKTDFSEWRGRIDVLSGGFPCQPFSTAGQRKGASDDRFLWDAMLRCIQEVRPAWYVGENVNGIRSMVFPSEAAQVASYANLFGEVNEMERRERYIIEDICQQLESVGYSVQPMLIPACSVSAPHKRDRIFFIARRNDVGKTEGGGQDRLSASDSYCSHDGCGGSSETAREVCQEGLEKWYNLQFTMQPAAIRSEMSAVDWMRDRWEGFPSQSAFYGGDDGISHLVDCFTIPFDKWARQARKANGNAIVPQVIYEIFRGIDLVSKAALSK